MALDEYLSSLTLIRLSSKSLIYVRKEKKPALSCK